MQPPQIWAAFRLGHGGAVRGMIPAQAPYEGEEPTMRKGSYSEELVRNKLEELVVILGDHVVIPSPHQAMKCQGKRHSVRGPSSATRREWRRACRNLATVGLMAELQPPYESRTYGTHGCPQRRCRNHSPAPSDDMPGRTTL